MMGVNFFLLVASVLFLAPSTNADDAHQCHDLYEYDASVKGTVSSPFYGTRSSYHKGLWCEYRIRAPEGYRIKITFKELDIAPSTDCRDDQLLVYGKDMKTMLGNFCGTRLPHPLLSNEGENEIRLLFRTDSAGGRGFLIEYESGPNIELCESGHSLCADRQCYKTEKKCDGVYDCEDGTDEEKCNTDVDEDAYQCHDLYEYDASIKGNVSSPFYATRPSYHDGLWCEYRIRAPEGYRIKVTFKDLDIDPSTGCGQDQLIVYGKDKQSVLGNFCGAQLPNPLLSNEGESEIRLLFRSDYMVGGRGFLLEYESGPNLELCDSGYSQCNNRKCYKTESKCDGLDNCGDGTDEENCNRPIVTQPEECSVQKIKPNTIFQSPDRMVGGEAVIPNSWPWQVSLQQKFSEPNGHFCGGTLINAQWVLTATHCVAGFSNPKDIKVVLGAHGKFTKTQYEQVRTGLKVIAYPDLEGEDMRRFDMTHDISVIKLNAPVTFNDGVQPACLPGLGWKATAGWSCYATGWGESRGSGGSDALKQMEQVVQPLTTCSVNADTQICVEKPNNSPCHGDSGGPLHCRLGSKWFVFGAASYVTTTNFMSGLCTGPGAMTVYAASADKADWIRTIVNKYS